MELEAPATACRLESERLVLEPLRSEHAGELAPVLGDAALHHYIGGRPPDAAEVRARVARQVAGRSPDGLERWLNWTVRERKSGQVVGTVQATVTGPGGCAVAELAWVLGIAHQRQGFAREAAGLVASWLHARHMTLRAHIHPGHRASNAVARSIGLRPTDVIKDGERRWESPRRG
ncbi:MAG: GNAT family N-acetyltransferase [Solirubrobacteraceae bacterium]